MFHCCFFFFKRKTAYEMRISDWSSDVCSSDLKRVFLMLDSLYERSRRRQPSGGPPERIGRSRQNRHWTKVLWAVRKCRSRRWLRVLTPTPDPLRCENRCDWSRGRVRPAGVRPDGSARSEEHTSELQSLMRISYA